MIIRELIEKNIEQYIINDIITERFITDTIDNHFKKHNVEYFKRMLFNHYIKPLIKSRFKKSVFDVDLTDVIYGMRTSIDINYCDIKYHIPIYVQLKNQMPIKSKRGVFKYDNIGNFENNKRSQYPRRRHN